MPLSSLLKSAAGTYPFCHQKAGILSREHPECRQAYQAGWQEMVQLATQAAGPPDFDENQLPLTMAAVAQRSYADGDTVNQALETGWKLGVNHSMADGIITQDEEARLREFRDQLALGSDCWLSGPSFSWQAFWTTSGVIRARVAWFVHFWDYIFDNPSSVVVA